MKEKDFQREFKTKNQLYGAFELKLCKSTAIPFKSVAEHQVEALLNVNGELGIYHKIADQTIGKAGAFGATLKKPFDCFRIKEQDAYVVIMFYTPRVRKEVYYIDIHSWLDMQEHSSRLSATEEMCEDYAMQILSYLKK